MNQNLVSVQNEVQTNLQNFLASIIIPNPPSPFCLKIGEAFRRFAKDPKNTIQSLEMSLSLLNMSNEIPHTKSRLCGGLLKKGDKAYKCHDCITEDNSILCHACFDLDKHINHQFERIDVYGGCCDCGDIEKWRESTFCNAHSQQQQVQVNIKPDILSKFIQQQHFAIAILLDLYAKLHYKKQQFDSLNENEEEDIDDIKKKVMDESFNKMKAAADIYGTAVIVQLILFNRAGDYAHLMTHHLFDSLPPLTVDAKRLFGEMKYLDLIFKFFLLHSTPEKVCDLCITMFSKKGFRKFITIFYIERYNNNYRFATSNYTHLSSQLFTSYLVISELLREGSIAPIQFKPVIEGNTKLQVIAEGYLRFYYDIMYLSKLHGSASSEYFLFYAKNERFKDLGYYRMLFNDLVQAKDYYGLEDFYLIRLLPVIKLIQKNDYPEIYFYALKELYQFITSYKSQSTNLYRSQERLFSIIAFIYLKGDINSLDDPEIMQKFIMTIGIKDWRTQLGNILSIMCRFLYYVSRLCDSNHLIQSNLTLYSFYFRRSNMLFNLDSILLKIVVKLFEYLNKTVEQSQQVHYEQYIVQAGEPNENIFYKLDHMQGENIKITQYNIIEFVNYINLTSEAFYSDLPELAIASLLNIQPKSIIKLPIQKSAYRYYENILKSTDNSHISIKEFKAICESFFKEEEVFKIFANEHMDNYDNRKLDAAKSKGSRFNLQYFKSVNSKVTGINHSGSLTQNPYGKTYMSRFFEIDFVKYTKLALKAIQMIPRQSLQKTKHSRQGLNALVISELWKLLFQTHSPSIKYYFHELANNEYHSILPKIPHMAESIIAYFKQHETVSAATSITYDQMQGDKRKKEQLMKRRLQNKKNEMKSKMKKGVEQYLKIDQLPVEEEKSRIECCICRDDRKSEVICYAGFLSISNFHCWFTEDLNKPVVVLNSCGHYMHRDCYKKTTQRNRIYNYCLLCKSPINLLLPLSSQQSEISIFQKEFEEVLKCLEQKQTDIDLLILEAAVYQIILKGLFYPNQYKKEITLWRIMKKILCKMVEMRNSQMTLLFTIESITQQTYFKHERLFDYVFSFLYSKIFEEEVVGKQSIQLNPATGKRINSLMASMCGQEGEECMEDQSADEYLKTLRENIALPKPAQNLAELYSRFIGKCPICRQPTNQQMICLICPNFVVCSGCSKMKLMQHSNTNHIGSCCFLRSYTGEYIYIYRNRYWKFESIYEDYMGRPYQAARTGGPNTKEDYKLVQKKIASIRQDIINNSIQLKIRYKQKSDNKVFYDENL